MFTTNKEVNARPFRLTRLNRKFRSRRSMVNFGRTSRAYPLELTFSGSDSRSCRGILGIPQTLRATGSRDESTEQHNMNRVAAAEGLSQRFRDEGDNFLESTVTGE